MPQNPLARLWNGRGMRLFLIALTHVLFGNTNCSAEPGIDKARFEALVQGFSNGQLTPPPAETHRQQKLQYVFVTGFGGEFFPWYFTSQIRELERLGVEKSQIHVLRPDSNGKPLENAAWLEKELAQIDGSLVLVAHSKGAFESLVFAVQHPEFIEQRVRGLYLIQGAFRGSAIADILERRRRISAWSRHTWWERINLLLQILRGRTTYGIAFPNGLKSLTTESADRVWQDLANQARAAAPRIRDKVYFVTAVSSATSPTKREIEHQVGETDDVLHLNSQSIPELGKTIALLKTGHVGLVTAALTTKGTIAPRAFIRSVFTAEETRDKPEHHLCPWRALAP